MITEGSIIEGWCRALHVHYALARGERLGELYGRRPRLLDERGLHPSSVEVGRILALQELVPQLEELGFNHLELRKVAQEDASRQHAMEIATDIGVKNGWITSAKADAMMRLHSQSSYVEGVRDDHKIV